MKRKNMNDVGKGKIIRKKAVRKGQQQQRIKGRNNDWKK